MSKPICYVRVYKDKVEVGGKDSFWTRYYTLNHKIPSSGIEVSVIKKDILYEIEHAQDLGWEVRIIIEEDS